MYLRWLKPLQKDYPQGYTRRCSSSIDHTPTNNGSKHPSTDNKPTSIWRQDCKHIEETPHLGSKPEVDGHQEDNLPILMPWTHQLEEPVEELQEAKKWTPIWCHVEGTYCKEEMHQEEGLYKDREGGETSAKLSVTYVIRKDTSVATALSTRGTNEAKDGKL